MIRSTHLASAAIAALLALPAAALAQSTHSPAAAATTPPSVATTSPVASHPAPGATAEQRVETYIRQLHMQLHITPAERPQWDRYVAVMRVNARAMDQELAQRIDQFPTMDALQNLQSYEKLAEAHVQHVQKLVPAFEDLYNAMPEQQKRLTDQVFREHAEAHAQQRAQTAGTTAR
jgi:periplasmic protein CpxP/Spy